ncbi:MAG: 50S ribosomal protein L11 methyltransferase [Clostridia bacterium]|nr:50S ribosomal protein L11 methyltransferase [Clostridia bacterium]
MKYTEVKIYPAADKLDELIAKLSMAGMDGVIISDPEELEGIMAARDAHVWDYVDPETVEDFTGRPSVTFYIQDGETAPEAMEIAKEWDYSTAHVDDEDWLHKWEEYFMPTKITDKFVVKPTWREYTAKPGEQIIEIDPGMAFGTGTHATTFLTLRLIEKYLKPGDTVLDVGSGSGILSIGAAKLGASDILAIDLFTDAVESTEKNCILNKCSEVVRAQQGDLTKGVDYKADMVAANLMADLVIMLSADVAKHIKQGGIYISSGILDEKEEKVSEAIRNAGFEIIEVLHADGWCAIAAKPAA